MGTPTRLHYDRNGIKMHYRREIDGLRAVAVLPVIFFHAGFSVFSGGFVGVDVFFVISGYLITSILIAELEQGNFCIARFYVRRARRILPALFVVMFACLPFAYVWMLPSQLKDFAQSSVAVVFFASNVLFWREDGYFGAAAELKPLLHTWSLAVEEQYYLLFPLFLVLLWRFGRQRVFWIVVAVAVLSLLLAEWGWRNKPSANFYLAPPRAWELLAGSVCAFLTVGKAQRSSNVLSAAGFALIVFAVFYYSESTPFPSVYTLVPVVGTALIILFAAEGTWVAQLLSLRGFVGIGLISYSAYLWHQPLFAFARLRTLTEPSHTMMSVLAAAALLLAWATWYWVERAFRRRANPLFVTQQSLFLSSGVVGAVFVAAGLAGHFGNGFEWRTPSAANVADLDERVIINNGLHADCDGPFNKSKNCYTSLSPNILLWGDSFAMHLAQGILESEDSIALQQHTKSSCSPILGVAQLGEGSTRLWAEGCIAFNNGVLEWLRETKSVDLVILSSPFAGVLSGGLLLEDGDIFIGEARVLVANLLVNTVQEIRRTGSRVLIVSPTPASGWDIGQCLMRSVYFAMDEASCNFALETDMEPFLLLGEVENEVAVYWLHQDFCRNEICDVMQDEVFIYRDAGHLSKEGSAFLGRQHSWMETFRQIAN